MRLSLLVTHLRNKFAAAAASLCHSRLLERHSAAARQHSCQLVMNERPVN